MNLYEKQSKTRERFPLSSRRIIRKTIGGRVFWILAFYAGVLLFKGVIVGVIVFILSIPLRWLYEAAHFKNYFYDMGDDYFVIRRGVFTTHELIIRYNRIQDIYIDQYLIDRLFGLYDVHISSATQASGLVAHVAGLTKANAEGLRNALLNAARNAHE